MHNTNSNWCPVLYVLVHNMHCVHCHLCTILYYLMQFPQTPATMSMSAGVRSTCQHKLLYSIIHGVSILMCRNRCSVYVGLFGCYACDLLH